MLDLEARGLGTPNHERASLETWIELASSDDTQQRDVARTLLSRYVHPDLAPADWSQAARWYAQVREQIVFVDSAGFWWLRAPE